jgi:propionyl-CoA synthetase
MPDAHARATAARIADPGAYWLEAARALDWADPPREPYHLRSDGLADWFPDGRINIAYNALDRHVRADHGTRTALIWESAASNESRRYSYAALTDAVSRFAAALLDLGLQVGDRVMICMPPVPEAVIAMLACARIGAVHVFSFAGFAGPELASRIDDTRPRLLLTASCGYLGRHRTNLLPAITEALLHARHRPEACILLRRPGSTDTALPLPVHDFASLIAHPHTTGARPLPATHPLYILHTSGTTGQPKGVVRDHGGHAVALLRSMSEIYGMAPGEVFFCTADLGWVVGHSYGVYGPLLAGCTSLLYEGGATGTPDAGAIWRLAAHHQARLLFTAPSVLRAIRAEDPEGRHAAVTDLSSLRAVFVAGERAVTADLDWTRRITGRPVFDHWWQTETGSAIAGSQLGLDALAQAGIGRALPGMPLVVLDDAGRELPPDDEGELALRLPLPPGCLTGLWQSEARFHATYLAGYPGYYRTYDRGLIDLEGNVTVLSRLDDVIKIAGRRISAGRIEEVISRHPDVLDCAVTARPHPLRGEEPMAFVVRRSGGLADEALKLALITAVRAEIGRFARPRTIVFLPALPRTRSGKIVRQQLRRFSKDSASMLAANRL